MLTARKSVSCAAASSCCAGIWQCNANTSKRPVGFSIFPRSASLQRPSARRLERAALRKATSGSVSACGWGHPLRVRGLTMVASIASWAPRHQGGPIELTICMFLTGTSMMKSSQMRVGKIHLNRAACHRRPLYAQPSGRTCFVQTDEVAQEKLKKYILSAFRSRHGAPASIGHKARTNNACRSKGCQCNFGKQLATCLTK